MNEASSKFVDTLAIDKIIHEMLLKVKHTPTDSPFYHQDIPIERIKKTSLNVKDVKEFMTDEEVKCFILPSYKVKASYVENDSIYLYYHPSKQAIGNIILIHGMFDDNRLNYSFLIKQLNTLGFNVFFMILPFHYERKPKASLFSGEFFLSADLYRVRYAFKQALFDIEMTMQFVSTLNQLKSMITGFSMGGCVACRYHLIDERGTKLFLINPVTDFMNLISDNPLLGSIKSDIEKSKLSKKEYEQIFKELDPCENLTDDSSKECIAMVYSAYDQIIEPKKYEAFIQRMTIKKTYLYNCGHLNVLRVPRLATDIYEFFNLN